MARDNDLGVVVIEQISRISPDYDIDWRCPEDSCLTSFAANSASRDLRFVFYTLREIYSHARAHLIAEHPDRVPLSGLEDLLKERDDG